MFRLVLDRSWINTQGTKYPVGTIIQVDRSLGRRLLEDGIARHYTGDYPPNGKLKTEFFKPK